MTQSPPPDVPESFTATRTGRRLRRAVEPRLPEGDRLLAWTRAWVSHDGPARLLAVRYRDFVVLTDRTLMCWSAGFLTRRPRRRVLFDRLEECAVEPVGRHPGRSLRVRAFARRPLRFDFPRGTGPEFARLLTARVAAARAVPASAAAGEPPAHEPQPERRPSEEAPWRA